MGYGLIMLKVGDKLLCIGGYYYNDNEKYEIYNIGKEYTILSIYDDYLSIYIEGYKFFGVNAPIYDIDRYFYIKRQIRKMKLESIYENWR